MMLMINLLRRVSIIGWREYFAPQWPAIVGSAIMALAMWGVNISLSRYIGVHSILMLMVSVTVGMAAYIGTLLVWRPKRLVALYQELSGDAKSVVVKGREKIAAIKKRLGWGKEN
jgi:hypothetical protein